VVLGLSSKDLGSWRIFSYFLVMLHKGRKENWLVEGCNNH
jgi:hypothetical protein